MERDCHNCTRPGTPDGVCPLSSKDTKTCLDNPSRPFWKPVLTDKDKLNDFISKSKTTCPTEKAKNGLICDFCYHDNAAQLGPCLDCDKTYSKFVPRTGKTTCPIEQDPNDIHQHEPGAKCDLGKLRVGLMFKGFPRALLAVSEVVTYGAAKYTPLGFLEVPEAVDRYDDAKARHLLKGYLEEKDPESELLHMQHEAWNALAKLEIYLRNKEKELA